MKLRILNAYAQDNRAVGGEDGGFEIYSFVFFVPRGVGNAPDPKDDKDGKDALVTRGIKKSSSDHVVAHFGPAAHHHLNAASNQFRVDLVDDDEGDAMYNVGVSGVAVGGDDGTAAVFQVSLRLINYVNGLASSKRVPLMSGLSSPKNRKVVSPPISFWLRVAVRRQR